MVDDDSGEELWVKNGAGGSRNCLNAKTAASSTSSLSSARRT